MSALSDVPAVPSAPQGKLSKPRTGRRYVRKKNYVYKHECKVCDYGTDKSNTMKRHQEMHAGE